MKPQLIDSHCHLNYDYSPKSLEEILKEATQNGVSHLVTIGTDLESISEIQKISQKYEPVFHTIGVHPHDVNQLTEVGMSQLKEAAQHPKCRAIGEIGLDYHYDHSPRDQQKHWLNRQLELALDLKLPIVIHSREGEEDLLAALTQYTSQLPQNSIPGIIHCFSGTAEFGMKCIELGFYISFSGILTFKKADEIRTAAQSYPLEKLLIETDAPFLAPIPHRGKKCEPSMVTLTAQKLAEIKGVTLEKVAEITTQNAKRVFRIEN
jgi:TatD DNase family protein